MRAHKYPPNYTVAEYQKWDGEWELIDGYPYAMSPSATYWHQKIASEIIREVSNALKKLKTSCGNCDALFELDWVIDDNTVVRPDVVVVCNQTDKFITKPPVLIVEILSPATALKDRNLKYEIYEEQGVKYYIIIDPETKQFNIFVLANGSYQEQNDTRTFSIINQCAIEIDLAELLAAL